MKGTRTNSAFGPMDTLARQVEQEVPFLRKLVRRWCQEKSDADDLVQDTVVRALTYASTYEPGTNLRAWLSTIMRNEFLSGRQKVASLTSMLRVFTESDHAAGGDPSEERLKLRDISRALTRLPAEQRHAVYYICIEGMSYEDAAKVMGASVASVRMNLSRGRNRLRTAVEGEQPRSLFALPRRNPRHERSSRASGLDRPGTEETAFNKTLTAIALAAAVAAAAGPAQATWFDALDNCVSIEDAYRSAGLASLAHTPACSIQD